MYVCMNVLMCMCNCVCECMSQGVRMYCMHIYANVYVYTCVCVYSICMRVYECVIGCTYEFIGECVF